MQSIAVDTVPLIALYNRRDNHHAAALRFFKAERRALVTNLPVITETCQMLDFSTDAVGDFLQWVSAAFQVDRNTTQDFNRIVEIVKKYADLPADFADASLVAMCERLEIDRIATLDRDLEVFRKVDGHVLENVLAMP